MPQMTNRRRVLVIAYFFPPVAGAGVQRTLKFVRHLVPLGWDATVISTRSRVYSVRDETLLDEIPDSTRVIRTVALPVARYAGIVLQRLGLNRLRAYVLWPDSGLGWLPFAFAAALRETRRSRPDVLVSTSAPYGGHLAALFVARLTGVPWVADFRDEWSTNPHGGEQPRGLTALTLRTERAITRRANKVVVAADYFHLAGLPAGDPRRVEIMNGVDGDDLPETSTSRSTDRFVLAHVGTLYGIRDPSPVFRALAALAGRGEIDRRRLQVRLVGNVWLPDFEPPAGLRVETTGYVDHARALEEMHDATALLLYVPHVSLAPTGKLYEYLASGRPLLCLTREDNLASRLVRELDAGVVAEPDDQAAIERAFLGLWQRWSEKGLPDQEEVRARTIDRYSRRAAAERLAQVLDEASRD